MGAIMLTQIRNRLRGYDKWIETEAKILSSELTEPDAGLEHNEKRSNLGSPFQWHSTCMIGWTDVSGISHKALTPFPNYLLCFKCMTGKQYPSDTIRRVRESIICANCVYIRQLRR